MCGIAGIASFDPQHRPDVEQLRAMCDTLVHRGPDGYGGEVRDEVALGMRRLAVIDVAGGQQPIFNEDRSVRVVFNGEIYNHRELRRELEALGHRFATHSDTEVIVHLWEEHGPGFVDRLNGMFAIALHDLNQRRLIIARDHLGIKPLFYSLDRQRLVFGSEVKAVLASGLVQRRLDVDMLGQFLAWEYVPGPGTLLKDIRKLEPGCLLDVDLAAGQASHHRFWDLPPAVRDESNTLSDGDWIDRVDDQLRRSVRKQLVSDVPLGAFLSGGVDSSLVVASMEQARTFSIGFDDPTYNELPWAQRVADHLGVDHRFEIIRPRAAELFDQLMPFMDDPIGDFSIFATYLVSHHARQHVTVSLSGDGGDELFGGYETYLAQEKARQWQRMPPALRQRVLEPFIRALRPTRKKKGLINKAKRFVEGLEHPASLGHARWRLFVGESMRRQLVHRRGLARDADAGGRTHRAPGGAGTRSRRSRSRPVHRPQELPGRQLPGEGGPHVDGGIAGGPRALSRQRPGRTGLPDTVPAKGGPWADENTTQAGRVPARAPRLRLQAQGGLQRANQALAQDRPATAHGGAARFDPAARSGSLQCWHRGATQGRAPG
jgi:asparagine synthase (glutamine-hydrolysing)